MAKADKMAGKSSFLSALKARREALEAGDAEGGRKAYLDELKVETAKAKKAKKKGK